MKAAWAICLVLVFVLSGCFGPDAGDAGNIDPGTGAVDLTLADLVCDFTYPETNESVSCENQFETVPISPDQPTTVESGWSCIQMRSDQPGVTYWIHWNPVEDKHGIYWEAKPDFQGIPINGIIYSRAVDDRDVSADRLQAYTWSGGGDTGFVEFPSIQKENPTDLTTRAYVRFYTLGYESDTPALADGQIGVQWTHHGRSAHPVIVLETSNDTHYLRNVTVQTHPAAPPVYHLNPFSLTGKDFNITVNAEEFFYFPDAWQEAFPRAGCAVV